MNYTEERTMKMSGDKEKNVPCIPLYQICFVFITYHILKVLRHYLKNGTKATLSGLMKCSQENKLHMPL